MSPLVPLARLCLLIPLSVRRGRDHSECRRVYGCVASNVKRTTTRGLREKGASIEIRKAGRSGNQPRGVVCGLLATGRNCELTVVDVTRPNAPRWLPTRVNPFANKLSAQVTLDGDHTFHVRYR
jgi:hypothetical protein